MKAVILDDTAAPGLPGVNCQRSSGTGVRDVGVSQHGLIVKEVSLDLSQLPHEVRELAEAAIAAPQVISSVLHIGD